MVTSTAGASTQQLKLWERGTGSPVLFLHAFPLDSSQWDHQVAALSDSHRCIRADLWGANGTPAAASPPDLMTFAAAIATRLLADGVTRLAVVGLSLGGYVALELIADGRLEISNLVLANTHCFGDDAKHRFMRAANIRGYQAETFGDAERLQTITSCIGPRRRDEAHVVDPQLGRMRRWSIDGLVWAQEAMGARMNRASTLAAYTGRLTCIGSTEDSIVPIARMEEMARLVPSSTVTVLEGVGHFSNLEDPPAFTAACARAVAGAEH